MLLKVPRGVLSAAKRLREDFHRHPELAYEEERTAARVAAFLRDVGLDEVRTGVGETGVVGLLRGARAGRTVALRADMDALPIQEETGLAYASARPGVMHACGHDGHTAILLAVARVLAGMRERVPGNVKFVFQPAEEGGAGAEKMVRDGVLRDPDVHGIFALHASSNLKPGQVELSLTPNAGVNGFRMEVLGQGAHGARPHEGVDPIMIATQIITAAQSIVTRERRPDRPVVLSFCAFHAGTKDNIIPDRASLLGTIRATDLRTLRTVRRALERVSTGVARSLRGRALVEDIEVYPPVRNDPGLLELVRRVGTELLGSRNVVDAEDQSMGGEDFSFYLSDQGGAPGVIFRLGVESRAHLHSARFDFGSAALEPGILVMVNLALAFLCGD
jgi:amidohydrolase